VCSPALMLALHGVAGSGGRAVALPRRDLWLYLRPGLGRDTDLVKKAVGSAAVLVGIGFLMQRVASGLGKMDCEDVRGDA
jgi:hypothetical protein